MEQVKFSIGKFPMTKYDRKPLKNIFEKLGIWQMTHN